MGNLDYYKPVMAMLGLQFTYAGLSLLTRTALLEGMSPRVFVVYRQAIAALLIAPVAYFTRRGKAKLSLGMKSFCLIFFTTLIGVTINQNIYFEGLYLASTSMASAMGNLLPAITFITAAFWGMENLNLRSVRSNAKIVGTLICIGGAVLMTFYRGPKLLNSRFLPPKSLILDGGGGSAASDEDYWLLGSLLLFGSNCCWSLWLILQVPVTASYPDHLSLSAWMCFMAALQSASVTFFLEPDPNAWKLHSFLELGCCLYAGMIGSAFSFFVQAWCISRRGPLFSAMFNPLGTVITTFFAAILLHEEIYTGSMLGAVGVIAGLYAVLWGKAKDNKKEINVETDPKSQKDQTQEVKILVDHETLSCKFDLVEPLLIDKSTKVYDDQTNQ
ncbi:WAT1-related protein At4g30420-like isoform X1 [Rhododendron vialii]|uniref:WAT1-related protein At4g30420-like isoform X1 n=1 Tax=Rhododendron vialii TaxID=182163 RepID=UPI00265E759D|nr:WAT1-related protein At4g30420-like isoform X1 [Rhododendron vialii]